MRWLAWLLLILALAIGASLIAGSNQGYVLIVRPPYRLEISLNFLLVSIVLTFILFHLLLRLIQYIRQLPTSVRVYKENQRLQQGHAALSESLHAWVQGRYVLAEKAAAKVLSLGTDNSLSTLLGARASHKLRNRNKRDYYLAEAERLAPEAAVERLLAQAELLLDDRLYRDTLHVLERLEKMEPRHPPAMRLALKVQVHLNNWEQVLTLLQHLEKRDALELWQLKEYRQQAYQHLIRRCAGDLPALVSFWKKIPEGDRLNHRIAALAAQTMNQIGAGNQALEILEMSLTRQWDSDLAGLLGDCVTTNPHKQLQQAEHWLTSHGNDARLLLSLGKMCIRLGLWGKAESYLEASLSLVPSASVHLALAKMLDSRDQVDAANRHYRQSAMLMDSTN